MLSIENRIAKELNVQTGQVSAAINLLDEGARAVLLYGPPRTGKTRAIDLYTPRTDPKRETIQIHDGWGYDEIMVALRPDTDGDGIGRMAVCSGLLRTARPS